MKAASLGLASLTLCVAIGLAGCAASRPAPVIERGNNHIDPRAETYTVKRYDTLYSIALEHGMDWQELAALNGITNPGALAAGQVLRVKPQGGQQQATTYATTDGTVQVSPVVVPSAGIEVRPLDGTAVSAAPTTSAGTTAPGAAVEGMKTGPKALKLPYSEQNLAVAQRSAETQSAVTTPSPAPATPTPTVAATPPVAEPAPSATPATPATTAVASVGGINWSWPTSGTVTAKYSDGGSKGVQIGGRLGEPILASANGKVTYVGDGVRGYGNLVIVKHNDEYLSVYAHNRRILVQSGQSVSKGQKIAEMGNGDGNKPLLHFEIRRFGKPVDPLQFLPSRAG